MTSVFTGNPATTHPRSQQHEAQQPNGRATQVSVQRKTDEHTVAHPCNGTLFGLKRGRKSQHTIQHDDPFGHDATSNNAGHTSGILRIPLVEGPQRRQLRDRKQDGSGRGGGGETGSVYLVGTELQGGPTRTFWGCTVVAALLCRVCSTTI